MFVLLRRRLVVKLGALMLATVGAGFLFSAMISARSEGAAMRVQHARAASMFSQGLAAGMRSTMLTGDPLATRNFIESAQKGLAQVHAEVFAPDGDTVFAPPAPPPALSSLEPPLRAALTSRELQHTSGDQDWLPLPHEARCTRCHDARDGLRGVLVVGTAGAPRPARDAASLRPAVTTAVRSGFVQIMTARRSTHLDEYFEELRASVPDLTDVAVYGNDGERYFGDELVHDDGSPGLTEADVLAAIEHDAPAEVAAGDVTVQLVPLRNELRCHLCHDPEDRMRGALAVATRTTLTTATTPGMTLAKLSDLSVRHIMLSGLGRLATGYLDDVAATGSVSTLRLYDSRGRLYHDAVHHTRPPDLVAAALHGSGTTSGHDVTEAGHERFVYVEALRNEPECQRCHGTDRGVRGALEIVIDTRREAEETRALTRQAGLFGVATMLLVLLALYLAIRTLVLVPMEKLSTVAEHVGMGDLDVEARISSVDEVGRLAGRLNEMVAGLRRGVHLSKFVSKSTVDAVASSGRAAMQRGGVRQHIVVLFSDIRGFTAYSEAREPEEVVAMLNAYLHAQSEAVHRHGGDIDKFVGDELMALFSGEGAEARAVRAAIDMIDAVEALNRERGVENIAIGVGINAGPAIVGAMGAEARMDFTAIGDTVNLGARLCSNAGPRQVLVSAAVRTSAATLDGITFTALDPIKVKGKAQPVEIFGVAKSA